MISALTIASRFILLGVGESNPVTPMKLQKLIYLANGIHLARFDAPLIKEDIEAWSYGPVIPIVYDTFKSWGNKPITDVVEAGLRLGVQPEFSLDPLPDDVNETIQTAWGIGKGLSGPTLSNWSHSQDSPWQKTYSPGLNKRIRRDIIRDYFRETMKITA